MIVISDDEIDTGALLSAFEDKATGSGGIVTFSGQVRPSSSQGSVSKLSLQAYSPMTERGIADAIAQASDRWDLEQVLVVHRTGDMKPSETIVLVATASAHRRAAFEAADFLMDYLKTKAVFWKKETTESGDIWIEPRPEDYSDANRWS